MFRKKDTAKAPKIKKRYIILAVVVIAILVSGIQSCMHKDDHKEEVTDIKWSDSELARLLPEPPSKVGKVNLDSADSLIVDIGKVTQADFDAYVESCREKGFVVDYTRGDDNYIACDEAGNKLVVSYDPEPYMYKVPIMSILLNKVDPSLESDENTTPVDGAVSTPQDDATQTPPPAEPTTPTEPASADWISPEFAAAMKDYEAFFDEYIAFIKKYSESDNALSMAADYAKYLAKYSEMMTSFEEIENQEMTDAEAKLYAETSLRIDQKLLEVL